MKRQTSYILRSNEAPVSLCFTSPGSSCHTDTRSQDSLPCCSILSRDLPFREGVRTHNASHPRQGGGDHVCITDSWLQQFQSLPDPLECCPPDREREPFRLRVAETDRSPWQTGTRRRYPQTQTRSNHPFNFAGQSLHQTGKTKARPSALLIFLCSPSTSDGMGRAERLPRTFISRVYSSGLISHLKSISYKSPISYECPPSSNPRHNSSKTPR